MTLKDFFKETFSEEFVEEVESETDRLRSDCQEERQKMAWQLVLSMVERRDDIPMDRVAQAAWKVVDSFLESEQPSKDMFSADELSVKRLKDEIKQVQSDRDHHWKRANNAEHEVAALKAKVKDITNEVLLVRTQRNQFDARAGELWRERDELKAKLEESLKRESKLKEVFEIYKLDRHRDLQPLEKYLGIKLTDARISGDIPKRILQEIEDLKRERDELKAKLAKKTDLHDADGKELMRVMNELNYLRDERGQIESSLDYWKRTCEEWKENYKKLESRLNDIQEFVRTR
jgi:uncharacterized coiled-coil DUF342 family protein